MTLAEIIEAVDKLPRKDFVALYEPMQERSQQITKLRPGTMDVDALTRAVDEIRAGLTDEQLEIMTAAMNEEYIEPFDETEWRS